MKISDLKVYILLFLYTIILLIGAILPTSISNYNYIVNICTFIIYFILYRLNKTIKDLIILLFLFLAIFLTIRENFLYMISDLLSMLVIFQLINMSKFIYIKVKDAKLIFILFLFYIFISFLYSSSTSYYNDERYIGLMQGTNLSATILVTLIITVWEIMKSYKIKLYCLWVVFSAFLYFAFLFKTRSLLFALPYFLYEFFLLYGYKKVLLSVFFVALLFTSFFIGFFDALLPSLRIEEDSSYLTRVALYNVIYDGLKERFFLIPHGFNAAQELIVKFTRDREFSVHNDFLRYLYDWGGGFIIVVYLMFAKLKCYFKNKSLLLLFFFLLSNSFQNMLFSIYIWIPVMFILSLNNRVQNKSFINL